MRYTRHGWQAMNGPLERAPGRLARCGGPGICRQCSEDASTMDSDEKAELLVRFAHHPPTSAEVIAAHEQVRVEFARLAVWVHDLLPAGDDRRKAIDAIDVAAMAANAAVARTQLRSDT